MEENERHASRWKRGIQLQIQALRLSEALTNTWHLMGLEHPKGWHDLSTDFFQPETSVIEDFWRRKCPHNPTRIQDEHDSHFELTVVVSNGYLLKYEYNEIAGCNEQIRWYDHIIQSSTMLNASEVLKRGNCDRRIVNPNNFTTAQSNAQLIRGIYSH